MKLKAKIIYTKYYFLEGDTLAKAVDDWDLIRSEQGLKPWEAIPASVIQDHLENISPDNIAEMFSGYEEEEEEMDLEVYNTNNSSW